MTEKATIEHMPNTDFRMGYRMKSMWTNEGKMKQRKFGGSNVSIAC